MRSEELLTKRVVFTFIFSFLVIVSLVSARTTGQRLAKINNRRGDHWSSLLFIRWFLAFSDEGVGLCFHF